MGHGTVDESIQKSGLDWSVRLSTPHFVSVGHVLQSTSLVATVPGRLATKLIEPFGSTMKKHPVKLPGAQIDVFGRAEAHRVPMNQRLRSVVSELFASEVHPHPVIAWIEGCTRHRNAHSVVRPRRPVEPFRRAATGRQISIPGQTAPFTFQSRRNPFGNATPAARSHAG